jgi:hypothetical protein
VKKLIYLNDWPSGLEIIVDVGASNLVMKTPSVSGSFLLLTISIKQNPVMV